MHTPMARSKISFSNPASSSWLVTHFCHHVIMESSYIIRHLIFQKRTFHFSHHYVFISQLKLKASRAPATKLTSFLLLTPCYLHAASLPVPLTPPTKECPSGFTALFFTDSIPLLTCPEKGAYPLRLSLLSRP